MNEHSQLRIEAIAAKALMLDPGDSFAVPVTGDAETLEQCVCDVNDALRREYAAISDLMPCLAHPDEILLGEYQTAWDRGTLIVERADGSEATTD